MYIVINLSIVLNSEGSIDDYGKRNSTKNILKINK